MGKSSEQHIEMNQQMIVENEEEQLRQNMIERFEKREIKLSYSSLKNFTSPRNLINYKLKKFVRNEGMLFGSVCDLLLLTPLNFDKEFLIIDNKPTTEKQINFVDELLGIKKKLKRRSYKFTDKVIIETYLNHYSKGDGLKLYESLKDYINGKLKGLDMISNDIYNEAKTLIDNLKEHPEIQDLLSQIQGVQGKLEWEDKGWKFIGYYDILLDNHIFDAKYSKDANPDKFIRDIQNLDYFLQGAMYCIGAEKMGIVNNPKYSFLVYDKSGNYSIIELDYSYIKYGERKYNYLLDQLNRCIDTNSFDKSYNYFKNDLVAIKPAWAKGYAIENEEL